MLEGLTVFTSWEQLAAAAAVLVLAQLVYVLLGFGSGLIAVGLLAFVLPDVRDAVVLLLLVNLPAEIGIVATSWRRVSWRGIALLLAGIAVGIPVGARLLEGVDAVLLLAGLGAVLVAAGLALLVSPDAARVRWPAWSQPPIGLLSGVLTGLFGTGGPPLVLYFRLAGADKAAFRGSLMAIFLAMTLIRVPSYAAVGLLTAPRLASGLALLPAVLLGAWAGQRIHLELDDATFRRLVSAALAAVGLVLVARVVV